MIDSVLPASFLSLAKSVQQRETMEAWDGMSSSQRLAFQMEPDVLVRAGQQAAEASMMGLWNRLPAAIQKDIVQSDAVLGVEASRNAGVVTPDALVRFWQRVDSGRRSEIIEQAFQQPKVTARAPAHSATLYTDGNIASQASFRTGASKVYSTSEAGHFGQGSRNAALHSTSSAGTASAGTAATRLQRAPLYPQFPELSAAIAKLEDVMPSLRDHAGFKTQQALVARSPWKTDADLYNAASAATSDPHLKDVISLLGNHRGWDNFQFPLVKAATGQMSVDEVLKAAHAVHSGAEFDRIENGAFSAFRGQDGRPTAAPQISRADAESLISHLDRTVGTHAQARARTEGQEGQIRDVLAQIDKYVAGGYPSGQRPYVEPQARAIQSRPARAAIDTVLEEFIKVTSRRV